MHIALNMVALRGQGSRRVGLDILNGLVELEPPDTIDAWIPSVWNLPTLGPDVRVRTCRSGALSKFATENLALRRSLRQRRPDILFSCGDTGPPAVQVPHLLLVQQAFLAYEFGEFDFELPLAFRAKLLAMNAYFSATLSTVSHITVQTHHVADRLAAKYRIPPDKIAIIPSAVSVEECPQKADQGTTLELCYVASAAAHKNHVVLADMVAVLAAQYKDLVCTVTVDAKDVPSLVDRARQRRVLENFRFVGAIEHDDAMRLIRRSMVALSPSKLESFGLPYFEALAMKTPQVVADRAFAREACGPAALYADPDSGEEFAACVCSLINSPDLYRAQQQRCSERFREVRLTPRDVAARYRQLMVSLIGMA